MPPNTEHRAPHSLRDDPLISELFTSQSDRTGWLCDSSARLERHRYRCKRITGKGKLRTKYGVAAMINRKCSSAQLSLSRRD